MSFGRPGGFGDTFKVSPPARGSFPLDHDGKSSSSYSIPPAQGQVWEVCLMNTGECRDFMMVHLKCIKENYGDVGKCRAESRKYLECRMDQ